MTAEGGHGHDPRWGALDRERKADAILNTLQFNCQGDIRAGTWLDVGCGSGDAAMTMAKAVRRVIGIDPESWERWSTFSAECPNLEFHVASYRQIPQLLGVESVDVAICNQVYEHVDDPAALLVAIHGVLKAGGICYFAGPNLLWPIEPHVHWPFVHWLPRTFAQNLMRRLGSRRAADLDAWSYTHWHLTRLFARAGFRYRSAIWARVRAEAMQQNAGVLMRAVANIPQSVFAALAPLSPAFVFVLTKAEKA